MNVPTLHNPPVAARPAARYFRRVRAVAALLAALCTVPACAPTLPEAEPERVVRRTGGVRRVGRFVPPYCYEHFVRGELFAARGDFEQAAEAYRMALAGPDEEDPLVMARLAEALDGQGREQAALEVLQAAALADPDSEAVWMARGRIAERHGRLEQAIEAYERAERGAPESARPVLELARLLREQGAHERAIAALQRFASRSHQGGADAARALLDLALSRGDATGVGRAVQRLLRVAPLEAEKVRQAAQLALESDRAVLAASLMDRIPRQAGDDALRLRILLEAGRLAEAEQLLAVGTPDGFGGLVATARAYLQVGKPLVAEQLARTALEEQRSPLAELTIAEALLAQGRYDRAAELFARVPAAAPVHGQARIGLARALAASGLPVLGLRTLAAVEPRTAAICRELRRLGAFTADFTGDPPPAPDAEPCPAEPSVPGAPDVDQ